MNIKGILLLFLISILGFTTQSQTRYVFHNTSFVNQQSYTDEEIYLNIVFPVPGYVGYFDGTTDSFQDINSAPTYTWPDGTTGNDLNVSLNDLPVNENGDYYIDIPDTPFGIRIYVSFGEKLYRNDMGNPLLDNPENPNYYTKVETIECNLGGQIFTNTSRVDRYAYPMGEELYCSNGQFYDKVGETVSHEMVIQKWMRYVPEEFYNNYDPTRDIISQLGHTSYFHDGNPGEDYFKVFAEELFEYYNGRTLTAEWGGNQYTATVIGNELIWSTGDRYTIDDFTAEAISGQGADPWTIGLGQIFGVCLNRGVVTLTEDVQVWDDPDNFWQNPIRNWYTNFFHTDLVSYDSKTYALAYDDVFDQSSTQSCQGAVDSVVISLGGFGVEHTQLLDSVYITPLIAEVDQFATIQLTPNGIDEFDLDMDIPEDAVYTWTVTNPDGDSENDLISTNGLFGPTDVTGDYEVNLTVEVDGEIYNTSKIVSVLPAGSTAQVCTGPVGSNAEYRLEIIGQKVYLTLVPLDGYDGSAADFFFGNTPNMNDWGHNSLLPNQPYPMTGFFFGDEVYFWLSTNQGNADNPVHIPNLGTCEGLTVLEEIVQLVTEQDITIDISETYTVTVTGNTNLGNSGILPSDPLFTEDIVFSGTDIDPATGVFTPSSPGVYEITISHGNVTTTTTITVIGAGCNLTVDLGNDKKICSGESSALVASISGLNPDEPFFYKWTSPDDNSAFDLAEGISDFELDITLTETINIRYSVENGSCYAEDTVLVSVKDSPEFLLLRTAPMCHGIGSFELTGPEGMESYEWSSGETTQEIHLTDVTDDDYALTVTNNGCEWSDTVHVTILESPTVTIETADGGNDLCDLVELTAVSSATDFEWSTGETTASITVTDSDTYTVTATIGSCTAEADYVVNITETPVFDLGEDIVQCATEGDVILTGPAGMDSYEWSSGEGTQEIIIADLTDSDYTLTVSNNGCEAVQSVHITIVESPTVTIETAEGGNDFCNLVELTAVSSATDFEWSTGETTASITVTDSDTYTVTATIGSCTAEADYVVNITETPTFDLGEDIVQCATEGDVTLTGPAGMESYEWSSGEDTQEITISELTDSDYTLTVTNNGCEAVETVHITIVESPTVTIETADRGNDFCNLAELTAVSSATDFEWSTGETTASITVTDSDTYTVTATIGSCTAEAEYAVNISETPVFDLGEDIVQCATEGDVTLTGPAGMDSYEWSSGEDTQKITIAGLTDSDYTLTVINNGCEAVETVHISIVESPTVTIETAEGGNDFCDLVELTAVSSATDFEWSTGETTASITVTDSDTYTVTATIGSCKAEADYVVNITETPVFDLGEDIVQCATEGDVTLAGPVGMDSYEWSSGETAQQITISGLSDSDYTLTVSNNGCESTETVHITIVESPTVIIETADGGNDFCDLVELTAVSSATGFEWSTGETTASITVTDSDTYTVTATIGSCTSEADYVVNISETPVFDLGEDVTVCEGFVFTKGFSISDNEAVYEWNFNGDTYNNNEIEISESGVVTAAVTLNGCRFEDGMAIDFYNSPDVIIQGKTELFYGEEAALKVDPLFETYLWSTGETDYEIILPPVSENSSEENPSLKSVTIETTDHIGCVGYASENISYYIKPELTAVNVSFCEGDEVVLKASENDEFDSYIWSNGMTDNSISVTEPGEYTVTATLINSPSNSNTFSRTVYISVNEKPLVELGNKVVICGNETVRLQNSFDDGSYDYTYKWSNNETGKSIDVSDSGEYSVTVTDNQNACTNNDIVEVAVTAIPDAPVINDTSFCKKDDIVTLEIEGENIQWYNDFGDKSYPFTGNTITIDLSYEMEEMYYFSQSIGGCESEINNVTVNVINGSGCKDSEPNQYDLEPTLFIPNALCPTDPSMGVREWQVFGDRIKNIEIWIYDGWGNTIWYSNQLDDGQPAEKWDGKYKNNIMQAGVYTYKIKGEFLNEEKFDSYGTIHLIR